MNMLMACFLQLALFLWDVVLFNIPLCLHPPLQTAAVTGTLPHPGHKTLRKWECCHPTADITLHWSPAINQIFTNIHVWRSLHVAEIWTETGTRLGQKRWTTETDNLTSILITPGITVTVKISPDSSLPTVMVVATMTRRAEAAKSRSRSPRAASPNSSRLWGKTVREKRLQLPRGSGGKSSQVLPLTQVFIHSVAAPSIAHLPGSAPRLQIDDGQNPWIAGLTVPIMTTHLRGSKMMVGSSLSHLNGSSTNGGSSRTLRCLSDSARLRPLSAPTTGIPLPLTGAERMIEPGRTKIFSETPPQRGIGWTERWRDDTKRSGTLPLTATTAAMSWTMQQHLDWTTTTAWWRTMLHTTMLLVTTQDIRIMQWVTAQTTSPSLKESCTKKAQKTSASRAEIPLTALSSVSASCVPYTGLLVYLTTLIPFWDS